MTDPAEIRAVLCEPYRHGSHSPFAGITCDRPLDLSGLTLSGVDFSGARFAQGLDARGARFDGLSWFIGAEFGGDARFDGAVFSSDARFEDARFSGAARFGEAEFRGIARFDRARFANGFEAAKVTCNGNCSLEAAQVAGAASLAQSEFMGGLWCHDAALPATTDLDGTQVHGRLWLRGARRGNVPLRPGDIEMAFGYTYA
ncbi:pentapeptide repeat-containing protein [Sinisalibacter aestuarii]|uniref:Pentapeptide repeat-containing protein n=1 Tax=Sinisalibacter aestuarii TaxID=2949426 RepID=A0ABQ5LWN8_9RHOB|nr:pentapeptide repeat-containing protein [Sinisalibacter aestuarii]GKY89382.1 hypothetical protein STA1M1_32510 [Sinisalibacter aestuarii]